MMKHDSAAQINGGAMMKHDGAVQIGGWLLTKLRMRESDRLASLGMYMSPLRSDYSECSVESSDVPAFGSKPRPLGSQQQ
eukprot:scaffold291754_cov18-Tisochrysis_lutea.AAC.1